MSSPSLHALSHFSCIPFPTPLRDYIYFLFVTTEMSVLDCPFIPHSLYHSLYLIFTVSQDKIFTFSSAWICSVSIVASFLEASSEQKTGQALRGFRDQPCHHLPVCPAHPCSSWMAEVPVFFLKVHALPTRDDPKSSPGGKGLFP